MLVRKGCVESERHGNRVTFIGDIFRKGDFYFEVIAIGEKRKVKIKSLTHDWESWVFSTKLHNQNLNISYPFNKTVHGVGYLGMGDYDPKIFTKAKASWTGMLRRVYTDESYEKVCVHESWHNFQNFAEWYQSQYQKQGVLYVLDKDVCSIDNLLYSSKTCLLLPLSLNASLAIRSKDVKRSELIEGWFSGDRYFKKKEDAEDFMSFCRNDYLKALTKEAFYKKEIEEYTYEKVVHFIERHYPYTGSY